MNIQKVIDCYFIPIWISVTIWLIISELNAMLGDGTYYYKLITSILTVIMLSFWIIVLFMFRKNQNLRSIDKVNR